MSITQQLIERANGVCELSQENSPLVIYTLPPDEQITVENSIAISEKCAAQLSKKEQLDPEFWKFLPQTMWSEIPAVQVAAWRMLQRLKSEGWAADALDILYLDDDTVEWAKSTGDHENDGYVQFHQDSLNQRLYDGDTVVLTKTLEIKGSSLKGTLGTVVKNIRLVPDNTDQIEGKIEGQTIVILTKYLRRQN